MSGDQMVIATICTRSYLPQARVLAQSFLRHAPDGRMVALIMDSGSDDLRGEPFEILTPHDVIPPQEFDRMATAYDIVELCTAVKPALLTHLLKTASSVHYLDPDIQFHSDPRFMDVLARRRGIVLTPHLINPPRHSGGGPAAAESAVLPAGVFNLGYIGVSRAADPRFLPWWSDRLRRDCLIDPDSARFVDQRWIDLVPGYFDHEVLRHPGVNLGWWNMPDRNVAGFDGQWTVDGEPLIFLHASGYNPSEPHTISLHHDDAHPFGVTDSPALGALLHGYGAEIVAAGYGQGPACDAGLGRVPGLQIPSPARRRYRDALVASELGQGPEPPNPFSDGVDAFWKWIDDGPERDPGIRPPAGGPQVPGINLVGYFTSQSSVGVVARLIAGCLTHAGIPHSTHVIDDPEVDTGYLWTDTGEALHEVTFICANADAALRVNHLLGPVLRDCHRVGLWWWETDDFPAAFDPSFAVVDEVWTGSEFTRRSIAARTDRPVRVIPLPVTVTANPHTAMRHRVGAKDGTFLVISVLSLDSVFARKNPLDAIDAYRRAFDPPDGAVLVLKITGSERHASDLARIRYAARERGDIVIVTDTLPIEDVHALIATCDCMLSMHRSEGFGLTLAEAMAYGRPVVATAYGGNTDFMDDTNAFLVPFQFVAIPADAAPYAAGGHWAAPDVAAAAALLRHIRENPRDSAARGRAGRERIERDYSPAALGGIIGEYLASRVQAMEVVPTPPDPGPARRKGWISRWRRREIADDAQTTPPVTTPINTGDPVAFYHSMTLPDGRIIQGEWTIDDMDSYLGNVPLEGRRVLDAGTATGLLAFAAEQRGAREVVALDLPLDADADPSMGVTDERRRVARERRSAVRRGFWEYHSALGSSVRLRTGDLRALNGDLGPFDVGILGNVLQHLRDPSAALLALADICSVVVVTEADWHQDSFPDDLPGMVMFRPPTPFSWFQVRPAFVTDLMALNGFARTEVTHHVQRYHRYANPAADEMPSDVEIPHFTVVCWRDGIP